MSDLKKNTNFDCLNLESMFDVVIKLDFDRHQINVQKLNTNVEFIDLNNGCSFTTGIYFFLNNIVSKDDIKRLLLIFDDIQNKKNNFLSEGFKFKQSRYPKMFCNGTLICYYDCCWICFDNIDKVSDESINSKNDYSTIIDNWLDNNFESIINNLESCNFKQSADSENKEYIKEYLSQLIFQSYVYISQNERLISKQKQAVGIQSAQERGVKFGRLKKEVPADFFDVYDAYAKGDISSREAGERLGVSHCTFLKWVRENNNCPAN